MSTDVAVLVAKVNQKLLDDEPGNISLDEHSGYTGYKPQAVVDAMNEAFGIGGWGFEEVSSEIVPGEKSGLALSQVKAWIKGVDFHAPAWGQNRVTRGDIGDAKKGAQTDALKKALSYFSIGARAYHGLLEKNGKPAAQDRRQPSPQPQPKREEPIPLNYTPPAQPTGAINAPVPSKLRKLFAEIGTTIETAQKMTFGEVVALDNLTPEDCFRLRQVYDAWKIKFDKKSA